MHNNRRKLVRSLAAMLLALAMALSLTACQVEIPGMGTININGENTPTGGNTPDGSGTDGDGMDGGEPGAYDDSLDLLRQLLGAVGLASGGVQKKQGVHVVPPAILLLL